ncbi:MAG: hypothetical protein KBE65_07280 [Phycisphaerae bacterium]|nr:hypothetical protein [Phycisphaerae bacterium]
MRIEGQIRSIITGAIRDAQAHPVRDYHVCYWQGRIRCLASHHTTKAHPVFFTALGQILAAGLSPQQWEALTRRILHFHRMTGLTLSGLPFPRVDARGNEADRLTHQSGEYARKTRTPGDSPWFRVWAVSGSCRSW